MNNKIYKSWYVLLVCCGLAASSIGISVNSSGVFYTPVSESLGIMRGTFAMHMTIFSLVTALSALVVPKLMNRFKYKLILITSVIVAVISTAMMAYAKNIYAFYLLGAIRGFSTGLFSIVPLTMIINGWFKKHHGLATSIVFGFSGLGGAICSVVLSNCILKFGWSITYIIKASSILILCLPAIIYPFEVLAVDEGKVPLGYNKNEKIDININKEKFNFFKVGFICFAIFAFINTAITGITQHLPGFAETIGQSATIVSALLSFGMIGNVITKLIIGFLSDRIGAVKASITMILVNMLGIILIISSSQAILLLIGAFLFGSIYSVGAVGLPLLTKYFFGTDNYSKVFPIISFLSNIGAALSLSFVGYIYDFTKSYSFAFLLGIGINIACLILITIVIKTNNKLNKSNNTKERMIL